MKHKLRALSEGLRMLYQKYGELLRYLVIGGFTTLIDIVCFAILTDVLHMQIEPAKVIVWFIAVSFAFVCNKWIVFRTKTQNGREFIFEAIRFFAMRLGSLGFALLFNHIAVRIWGLHSNVANLISTIFVIAINYCLGKLVVFRQK